MLNIDKCIYQFNDFLDNAIDSVFRINTHETVTIDKLNFENESIQKHAAPYQGVWAVNFFRLITAARINLKSKAAFVDLGSGRGRVCFLASWFGFKDVIGVEYDKNLISSSNQNKKISRFIQKESIQFLHQDASSFHLPEKQTFVFMFNPFDEYILELFLIKNFENLKKFNSKILYANDRNSSLLRKMGFQQSWSNEKYKLSIWELV